MIDRPRAANIVETTYQVSIGGEAVLAPGPFEPSRGEDTGNPGYSIPLSNST